MKVLAVIDRPAGVRQILDLPGLLVPPRAYRSPPERVRGLAIREIREWTCEPVEDDLPLHDALTT
jgi:hypothetical protein